MSGLDYANTCPIIDRGISMMESELEQHVLGIVEELCPMFSNVRPDCQEWVNETVKYMMQDLEPIFEAVRSSNEDIRSAADKAISELKDEIYDLQSQLEACYED